jgi:hypothetical protein
MSVVGPSDEIRRLAFLPAHVEDLGISVVFTDAMTFDHQPVSHLCMHGHLRTPTIHRIASFT